MPTTRIEVAVPGLVCEGPELEEIVRRIPGVVEVYVNAATEVAYCDCEPERVTPEQLVAALRELGYRARLS